MIGDRIDHANEWDLSHSYDRSTELPSHVVPRAVAGITNRNVCAIEPLYETIEPDALDAFIRGRDEDAAVRISFFYEGCQVYVDGDSVAVRTVDEAAEE